MKKQKYAQIERERRFIVPDLPKTINSEKRFTRIHDRYLQNSRLRLRSMQMSDGQANQYKLGQKYPRIEGDLE